MTFCVARVSACACVSPRSPRQIQSRVDMMCALCVSCFASNERTEQIHSQFCSMASPVLDNSCYDLSSFVCSTAPPPPPRGKNIGCGQCKNTQHTTRYSFRVFRCLSVWYSQATAKNDYAVAYAICAFIFVDLVDNLQ